MDTSKKNKLPAIAFLVGMGRSGTTLLTNMLNSHPNLLSTPENEFILFAERSFRDKDFGDTKVVDDFLKLFRYNFHTEPSIWVPGERLRDDIAQLEKKDFVSVCKLVYLNNPLSKPKENVSCIIDKNPVYSLHTKKLKELFPAAKFIVMVRNYKDNVLSRKKYAYKPTSLAELGVSWNYYYERIEKDMAAMAVQPYILRYEDLVDNPENCLLKLCAYLEIPFHGDMLNYKETAATMVRHMHENLSGLKREQVGEMHVNIVKDVKADRVNAFEKELSEEETGLLDRLCGYTAKKFGYTDGESARASSVYRTKMSLYLFKQKIYYSLPVSWRLAFLKEKK